MLTRRTLWGTLSGTLFASAAVVGFAWWSGASSSPTSVAALQREPVEDPVVSAPSPPDSTEAAELALDGLDRLDRLDEESDPHGYGLLRGRLTLEGSAGAEGVSVYAMRDPRGAQLLPTPYGGCDAEPQDEDAESETEDERVERHALDLDEETGLFEGEVPRGNWLVLARAEGYLEAVRRDVNVWPTGEGREPERVSLALERGASVRGRVLFEGEPVSASGVVIEGNGVCQVVEADEEGRFELSGLRPGMYLASAHEEWLGAARSGVVTGGGEVTLELAYRREVRGRVVWQDGRPAQARVLVTEQPRELRLRDPWGPFSEHHGISVGGGCGPWPQCRTRTQSAPDGTFAAPVSEVGTPILSAIDLDGTWQSPSVAVAGDQAGAIVLVLSEPLARPASTELSRRPR